MANSDFTAEGSRLPLSALLADKPALLRALRFLMPGYDLLVTVHARRTYLMLFLCRAHAVSRSLDPSEVRIPPNPAIPTIAPPEPARMPSQIQRAPCSHHGGASNVGAPVPASAPPTLGLVSALSIPQSRAVNIADPAKRMAAGRAFCTALIAPLAHKPTMRTKLFRLRAAASPLGTHAPASSTGGAGMDSSMNASAKLNTNTNANTNTHIGADAKQGSELASSAFAGLAFGALLLLDAPDLLRALADFVEGDEACAELAKVAGCERSEGVWCDGEGVASGMR